MGDLFSFPVSLARIVDQNRSEYESRERVCCQDTNLYNFDITLIMYSEKLRNQIENNEALMQQTCDIHVLYIKTYSRYQLVPFKPDV